MRNWICFKHVPAGAAVFCIAVLRADACAFPLKRRISFNALKKIAVPFFLSELFAVTDVVNRTHNKPKGVHKHA